MPYIPRELNLVPNTDGEPSYRSSLLPFATYPNADGSGDHFGFAVPGAIEEPLQALSRLFGTPSHPGTFGQGPDYPGNADDMRTLLMSTYAGNALNPGRMMEGAAARDMPEAVPSAMRPSQEPVGSLWHGSPHDFDSFDVSKIGTGEGAQVYGHGLYFAQNRNIANHYKDALSGGDGYLYQVNVDRPDSSFIDWDAPISSQPDAVRDLFMSKLTDTMVEKGPSGWMALTPDKRIIGPFKSRDLAQERASTFLDRQPPSVGTAIGRDLKDPETVGQLRDLGFNGIKYLDSISRDAGDGSRNYVLFSHEPVDVLHKWHGDTQLFSDTGKPSLMGSAVAGAEQRRGAPSLDFYDAFAQHQLQPGQSVHATYPDDPSRFLSRFNHGGDSYEAAGSFSPDNTAYLDWIGKEGILPEDLYTRANGVNTLGRAALRQWRDSFLQQFPDVKQFSGERVSGGRYFNEAADPIQTVSALFSDTGLPSLWGSALNQNQPPRNALWDY
jgi:hypothetical protein